MPKNILFIIPEMSMGGAQRSLSKISGELSHFHNVSIVVFNRNHDIAAIHRDEVLSLDVNSGSNPIVKIVAFWIRIIRLRRLKKRLSVDIAISFLEGADYVNILSRRTEKIVLSVRGSKVHDENMHRHFYWRKKMIKLFYTMADVIVCVNKGIRDEMFSFYGLKRVPLRTIYNFYHVESILQMANVSLPIKIQPLFENQTIVMSGRLAVEKGYPFVIELFHELRKQFTGLRFVIIGDGPEREAIIKFCKSLNIVVVYKEMTDRGLPDVFITGQQPNVYQYLKKATVYLLNSSSEGFPNGLAEAMACGVPIVAADCPYGPREILCDDPWKEETDRAQFVEYGILVPMPSSVSKPIAQMIWIEVIGQLLNSDEIRNKYSRLSIKRISEFSKERIINQWKEIIES